MDALMSTGLSDGGGVVYGLFSFVKNKTQMVFRQRGRMTRASPRQLSAPSTRPPHAPDFISKNST